jgi:hypothetical protein
VCGKSAACSIYTAIGVSPAGPAQSPIQDELLTGARIRATLKGYIPGTIQDLGDTIQPVLESDTAVWKWRIQPSRGGHFELFLTLTPLAGDSDAALTPDSPIRIHVTVTTTLWQNIVFVLSSIRDFLLSISGLCSALGFTVLGAILWIFRQIIRARKRSSSVEPAAPAAKECDTKQAAENKDASLRPSTDISLQGGVEAEIVNSAVLVPAPGVSSFLSLVCNSFGRRRVDNAAERVPSELDTEPSGSE